MKGRTFFARTLRKNQTTSEIDMWKHLRNRRLLGFKFLRQHPLVIEKSEGKRNFYIADFYCAEKKLLIEIDGVIHNKQIEYDQSRDELVKELGITVLRFTNDQVENNIIDVLKTIRSKLR